MLNEATWDIESVYTAVVCSKSNRVEVFDPAGRVLTGPAETAWQGRTKRPFSWIWPCHIVHPNFSGEIELIPTIVGRRRGYGRLSGRHSRGIFIGG
jgi:hypothetical protein